MINEARIYFLAFLSLFFFCPSYILAAEQPPSDLKTEEMVLVSGVNFESANIVSQKENEFVIDFSISNRHRAETGVSYSVVLMRQVGENRENVYEQVYDDSFDIAKDEIVNRQINFKAPGYFDGNYDLMLFLENKSGLSLSLTSIGEVKLVAREKIVNIENCTLRVEGESRGKTYLPNKGIDVLLKEKLIAECEVYNDLDYKINTQSAFEIYERSLFGELVDDYGKSLDNFSIDTKERKKIEFLIPLPKKPQAYELVFNLRDNDSKKISNDYRFHYVVAGESALITNLSLDKDYYSAGEEMTIFFVVTGPADDFRGSRLGGSLRTATQAEISVLNSEGENCISPISQKLDKDKFSYEVKSSVLSECKNPNINASLINAKGLFLDDKNFSFTSPVKEKIEPQSNGSSKEFSYLYLIIAIVIFLLLILFFLLGKRFKKNTIALLLFSTSIFLAGVIEVSADTYSNAVLTVTVNFKDEYAVSEAMSSPVSIKESNCGNYNYKGTVYAKLSTQSTWTYSDSYNIGGSETLKNFTATAPSSAGSYNVNFNVDALQNCEDDGDDGDDDCTVDKDMGYNFNVPFKVVSCTYISSASNWGACVGGIQTAATVLTTTLNSGCPADVATTRSCCTYISSVNAWGACSAGTQSASAVTNTTLAQATCPANVPTTRRCGMCNGTSATTAYNTSAAVSAATNACAHGSTQGIAYLSPYDQYWKWTCKHTGTVPVGYAADVPSEECRGLIGYTDIGLRIYDPSFVGKMLYVAVEANTTNCNSPFRIRKGTANWCIGLLPSAATTNPLATDFRIKTADSNPNMIRRLPSYCGDGVKGPYEACDPGLTATCNAVCSGLACGGSIPANASAHNAEESVGVSVATNWTYSASDVLSTKCQYKCNDGYTYNLGACTVTTPPTTLPPSTCIPRATQRCYDNDLYWYDSCSNRSTNPADKTECWGFGCQVMTPTSGVCKRGYVRWQNVVTNEKTPCVENQLGQCGILTGCGSSCPTYPCIVSVGETSAQYPSYPSCSSPKLYKCLGSTTACP